MIALCPFRRSCEIGLEGYRFVNNFPTCAARPKPTIRMRHGRTAGRNAAPSSFDAARSSAYRYALQKLLEVGFVLIGVASANDTMDVSNLSDIPR